MKAQKSILFFLLVFSILKTNAQKTVIHQNLYWLRYYNQLSLNNKLTWQNEFEDRRFFDRSIEHQFIIHSRFQYRILPNLSVGLGMAYSLQSPQILNTTSTLLIPEFRPEQEINFTNPISKRFSLAQRLRIDDRFIRKNNGKVLLDGYDFNFRFRYRLEADYKLKNEDAKHQTTLRLYDELMINAGKNIVYNTFDQNRIYFGVEQDVNKNFSAELGFMNWYQQKSTGNQFYDREIIRFTLYHKLNWK